MNFGDKMRNQTPHAVLSDPRHEPASDPPSLREWNNICRRRDNFRTGHPANAALFRLCDTTNKNYFGDLVATTEKKSWHEQKLATFDRHFRGILDSDAHRSDPYLAQIFDNELGEVVLPNTKIDSHRSEAYLRTKAKDVEYGVYLRSTKE